MVKGMNMQSVKTENRSQVLYLLNACKQLSRKEIAVRLGLTPAAVTKICNELMERGMICENGETKSQGKSGRREILLSLCLEERRCFGIHAETDEITFSICGFDGTLYQLESIPFTDKVEEVVQAARRFLSDSGFGPTALECCSICIIGSPKEDDFGVWKEPELEKRFELALGLPVVLENNVRAFAEAELLYGGRKRDDSVLLLKWGPGVGSAIVTDGKVYSGGDSSVTEIGHYIVKPDGKPCRCGRCGCLETEVNEAALRSAFGYHDELPLDEWLKNCDNKAIELMAEKITMVALALTNTATILNTGHVCLFGSVFAYQPIVDKLRQQCFSYHSFLGEDNLVLSSLNDKRTYIGAAAIGAKHCFFEGTV
ncbi:MAG: ROK family transcriptional regulator [Eubacterium sp.]|nr:ROK family transcriptional regulator [Eubacterium sp.]